MEPLLSLKEVAAWLRVTERTVFNLLREGELQGIKVGKVWRFDATEIRTYIQRQTKDGRGNAG